VSRCQKLLLGPLSTFFRRMVVIVEGLGVRIYNIRRTIEQTCHEGFTQGKNKASINIVAGVAVHNKVILDGDLCYK
jgi:hypothetical protein